MATTATEKRLLIGGEWVETGDWLDVRSPYSGDVVGRVAKAGADEARRAIDAAEKAMADPLPAQARRDPRQGRRRARPPARRGRRDDLRRGRQAAEGRAGRGHAGHVHVHLRRRRGAQARGRDGADGRVAGRRGQARVHPPEPIGIVGAISPFNFPLNLVAHKIAPALAAGCAVVLKPASATPLSALLLAELETEAGLPPGWLNVLVGPRARSATCWSRTSASGRSPSRAPPTSAGSCASAPPARR